MMAVSANDTLPQVARPPRAMAWVVLLAAAAAVLAVGVFATVVLFGRLGAYPSVPGFTFWAALLGAALLTVASISLRSLRWIFLLRRAETRIPIRDAYIGYFSGFSVLFAPLLAGEVAVRALVHRSRGNVPVHTTVVVNVWERLLDATALSMLAAVAGFAVDGRLSPWRWTLVGFAALSFITPVRRLALRAITAVTQPIARVFDVTPAPNLGRLSGLRTWTTALVTSVVAWVLPCAGLW
ncbi:MAG: lysylphosphatidylglycerol synthase domain-containing protein, partial [Vicinamibacterales bacterium]